MLHTAQQLQMPGLEAQLTQQLQQAQQLAASQVLQTAQQQSQQLQGAPHSQHMQPSQAFQAQQLAASQALQLPSLQAHLAQQLGQLQASQGGLTGQQGLPGLPALAALGASKAPDATQQMLAAVGLPTQSATPAEGPGSGIGSRPASAPRTRKVCSKCSMEKPVAEFWKDKTKPDGLYSQCTACAAQREESRRWASDHSFGGIPRGRFLLPGHPAHVSSCCIFELLTHRSPLFYFSPTRQCFACKMYPPYS